MGYTNRSALPDLLGGKLELHLVVVVRGPSHQDHHEAIATAGSVPLTLSRQREPCVWTGNSTGKAGRDLRLPAETKATAAEGGGVDVAVETRVEETLKEAVDPLTRGETEEIQRELETKAQRAREGRKVVPRVQLG